MASPEEDVTLQTRDDKEPALNRNLQVVAVVKSGYKPHVLVWGCDDSVRPSEACALGI